MKKYLSILIIFILCAVISNAKEIRYRINQDELIQLNQFILQCDTSNLKNFTGWPLPEGEQISKPSAFGLEFIENITQDNSEIQLIELSAYKLVFIKNGLIGSIPNFNLPNLKVMDLSDNKLSDTIPNFNLPNLEELNLAYNKLSGNIPDFSLHILNSLNLRANQLSGSIPNFDLPNLRDLRLADNYLVGTIPNFNMPDLEVLILWFNQLSGSIPNFNMPKLDYLFLSYNQLSGNIPNFNMPILRGLYMDNNQLSGSIPNFNMPYLEDLSLGYNQLSGIIPNYNMPELWLMDIRNNKLTFKELMHYSEFTKLSIYFSYGYQDTVLALDYNESTKVLTVLTNCEGNKYQWYREFKKFRITSVNYITLAEGDSINHYSCNVTNSILPDLMLKTRPAEGVDLVYNVLNDNVIEVNPNPSSEFINIKYSNPLNSVISIKLFDMSGKVVLYINSVSTDQALTIPISNLNSGTYLLIVEDGINRYTKNILVNR